MFGVHLPSSGQVLGAVGDGETREAALDDLRDALQALIAEVGIPDELTLTLNVA